FVPAASSSIVLPAVRHVWFLLVALFLLVELLYSSCLEEYAEENDYNRNQIKKAINNIMEFAEKINKERVDERTTLLKYSSRVSKTLEADSALKATMQSMTETNTTTSELLKGDSEFNQRLLKDAKGYIKNSAQLTEIANSLKALNFPSLQTRITNIENTQVTMQSDIDSIRTDTSAMKEMVIEMFNAF
ncbi:hypothetical protein Tco_1425868, partial [Tanacetum coccineum]